MTDTKHKGKFVTLSAGSYPGTYELKRTIDGAPPEGKGMRPKCACCTKDMIAVFDTMQMGFWQDHCETFFVCVPCRSAVKFVYDFSRIEPVKRGRKSK